MSAHEILQELRNLGARLEARGDRLRINAPGGTITPELKAKLAEKKAEILKRLELEESMRRLEAAGICIAVWEDGSMRIVITEAETLNAIDDGGVIYSPSDMYHYVQLTQREGRMLHDFKRRFGGTIEWKES
jgi:hypothetical protein